MTQVLSWIPNKNYCHTFKLYPLPIQGKARGNHVYGLNRFVRDVFLLTPPPCCLPRLRCICAVLIVGLCSSSSFADAPVCGTDREELLGALKHETLQLKCEVDASPPAESFHWTFNSSGEQTELPAKLHSSEVSLLHPDRATSERLIILIIHHTCTVEQVSIFMRILCTVGYFVRFCTDNLKNTFDLKIRTEIFKN